MLRAGTSLSAHIKKASRARSNAEFVSKLGGAVQEADETILWLELLRENGGIESGLTHPIALDAGELIAVMTTIVRTTDLS